jgi:hypothetical protein
MKTVTAYHKRRDPMAGTLQARVAKGVLEPEDVEKISKWAPFLSEGGYEG